MIAVLEADDLAVLDTVFEDFGDDIERTDGVVYPVTDLRCWSLFGRFVTGPPHRGRVDYIPALSLSET